MWFDKFSAILIMFCIKNQKNQHGYISSFCTYSMKFLQKNHVYRIITKIKLNKKVVEVYNTNQKEELYTSAIKFLSQFIF